VTPVKLRVSEESTSETNMKSQTLKLFAVFLVVTVGH
jgi:hypothetical protein